MPETLRPQAAYKETEIMKNDSTRVKQTTGTLLLSIGVGITLMLVKFSAGFVTHSMAVMASALDSLMDVAVSFVNLIAAREAAKPPDADHAYGHGKIESLAGLFQSTLIGLSGLYLIFESGKRLIVGTSVAVVPVGIGVMVFSIVVSLLLVWRIQAMAKKTKSLILSAEKLHFSADILTNGGVILALMLVAWTGWVVWDLVMSILVSLYIFKTSYHILRRSVDELLDKSLPAVSQEEIAEMIHAHNPHIVGIHNFRSRRVGDKIFMDFHIEIRGEDDFKRAHDMTESVIEEIHKRYPGSDVTVHYDPEGAV